MLFMSGCWKIKWGNQELLQPYNIEIHQTGMLIVIVWNQELKIVPLVKRNSRQISIDCQKAERRISILIT